MGDTTLQNEEILELRQQGIITEDEIAVRQGDLLLAVHVITQERRVISRSMTESRTNKRLLKG